MPEIFIHRAAMAAVLCILVFSGCEELSTTHAWRRIPEQEFSSFYIHDTLYNAAGFTAVESWVTMRRYTDTVRLIEKRAGGKKYYFKLDTDTRFENDSSLVYYSYPLLVSGDNGGFHKEGIWFYSKHDSEKVNWHSTDEGVQFSVDSTPAQVSLVTLPSAAGIYFYTAGSLNRVPGDQSEETFYSYGKTGFYFLPNPGRFYKRFTVNDIK